MCELVRDCTEKRYAEGKIEAINAMAKNLKKYGLTDEQINQLVHEELAKIEKD